MFKSTPILSAALALILLCAVWVNPAAFGQDSEAEQKAESDSQTGPRDSDETDEERRERFRRMRMGNMAQVEFHGHSMTIRYGNIPAEGADYEQFENLKPGEVARYVASHAAKFTTPLDLVFGDVTVKTGNAAEDYPGVYSLWLKKTQDGWALVFNDKADVWGTQHRPAADAAEVPLAYSTPDEPSKKLQINFSKNDDISGTLTLTWGPHHWTAPFTVSEPKS